MCIRNIVKKKWVVCNWGPTSELEPIDHEFRSAYDGSNIKIVRAYRSAYRTTAMETFLLCPIPFLKSNNNFIVVGCSGQVDQRLFVTHMYGSLHITYYCISLFITVNVGLGR